MAVTVPRLWPGETVAILATGPSLAQADVDACRGRVRVIAINDAHRVAPWADVLYSSDRVWWPHYKGVPEFKGPKYGLGTSVGKANPFGKYPDIQVLKNTGDRGLELEPSALRNGRNSGFAAVNLAVHFGASRILLLGYNMGWSCGRAHFFGNHPSGLSQDEGLYVGFRRAFLTLVEPLQALGVTVLNCTEPTSLDAFPCVSLAEALATREAVAS